MESRIRAYLRWIGGDYSTRYRVRIEATHEFTVATHTVVPYFDVEGSYDTRYDALAGTLYQMGPEVTVTSHFRHEIYLARKDARLPGRDTLKALGFVAKWYYWAPAETGRCALLQAHLRDGLATRFRASSHRSAREVVSC